MAPEPKLAFHTLDVAATIRRAETDPDRGLSAGTVAQRQAQYGPNALREGARRSKLRMLAAQFADFMILLLIAAAVVSGVIGDVEDTLVILGIVVLNAAVGFVQEFRAEQAMAALQRMAPQRAIVVRDGHPQSVPAESLVPGDVLLLEAGNAVPADLRLIEAVDLKLGEAVLTGESLPVDKTTARTRRPEPAARRSPQPGVQGHGGAVRPRARHCRGDRHGDGTRPDRQPAGNRGQRRARRCSSASPCSGGRSPSRPWRSAR